MRDLIGLERGDETEVQLFVDLMGDLVSLVFELLDLLGIVLQVAKIIGEIHKTVGRQYKYCGETVEMVKKDSILRNYPFLETHGVSMLHHFLQVKNSDLIF
jgi:hypothetical protein